MPKLLLASAVLVVMTVTALAQAWLMSPAGQVFKASGPPPVNNCLAVVGQLDFSNPNGCNIVWMGG